MNLAISITDWLFILTMAVTIGVSIKRPGRKEFIPIQLYILFSFIIGTTIKVVQIFSADEPNQRFESALVNILTLMEFVLFYYFLYGRLIRTPFKILMILFFVAYVLFSLTMWTKHPILFFSFGPELIGIECLLITISCLFNIYEILKSDLNADLKTDANFIVICGILFYSSISIPAYFSWADLNSIFSGFSSVFILANTIFCTLLMLTFMKAYLCPIANPKQLQSLQ